MERLKSRDVAGIVFVFMMLLLMILPTCRREKDPIDKNRPPNTILTSAPPETTEADYRVHLYWRGVDYDGVVERYMWYKSDTLLTLTPEEEPEAELLDWNPEARLEDYLEGRYTYRTDTVFIFQGYDNNTGALLNRQAFHIVAVDDGGLMDPSPARLQFFARVKGVPEVMFEVCTYDRQRDEWTCKPFNPEVLDTISMFSPIRIYFTGSTINNVITGYRWIYSGKIYPDENNDGVAEWYEPETSPPETVMVEIENSGDKVIPSGDFYFRVIAKDEAGALSKSDITQGIGVCHVVVNHDPDTRVLRGECFYTPQSTGIEELEVIDFSDDEPDTLPYNSRLRLHYIGWDNPKDSLEYIPPVPIRFKFMFSRWSGPAIYSSPWYPIERAEDTNLDADEDSTTMRVGTYDYAFSVRSYDEQYRYDYTPDLVNFVANFPPTLDSFMVGYDEYPATETLEFRKISNDTLYIGVDMPLQYRDGVCTAYNIEPHMVGTTLVGYTFWYKFFVIAGGHDHPKDPIGSGFKSWLYTVEADVDHHWRREGEWIQDYPLNKFVHEMIFTMYVPFDIANPDTMYEPVKNPPKFLGDQRFNLLGKDLRETDVFYEGIRAISPVYIPPDSIIPGSWIVIPRRPAAYARSDTDSLRYYIKVIK